MKTSPKKVSGFSTGELVIVVLILLILFVVFIDMSLYFRAPYKVQGFYDKLLTTMQERHSCGDVPDTLLILRMTAPKYFGEEYGSMNSFKTPSEEGNFVNEFTVVHEYTHGKNDLSVVVQCACDEWMCNNRRGTPVSIFIQKKHKGILINRNKMLSPKPVIKKQEYYE